MELRGIVESASFGCLKLVRERGLYFWQKPKVAKAFLDSALQNLGWILYFCVRDSAPCVETAVDSGVDSVNSWNLAWNRRICGGFCVESCVES